MQMSRPELAGVARWLVLLRTCCLGSRRRASRAASLHDALYAARKTPTSARAAASLHCALLHTNKPGSSSSSGKCTLVGCCSTSLCRLCCWQAREAYDHALKLEPSDTQIQLALQKAAAMESKQAAAGKHVFKRRLGDDGGDAPAGAGRRQEKRQQTVRPSVAKKEKTLLSFGEDEEQEEG